jgi:predicted esterase
VVGARVKHEVLERELARTNDLKVLLLHGRKDRAVPLRVAERSHRFVQAALGTPAVTLKTYPCGHTLTVEQLSDAGGWLREVFRIP